MTDLLLTLYPWIKAFHIMSVIAWMAALFYLPRLFVHHVERGMVSTETDEMFQMMEFKLQKVIMNPAMIATWIFGILLISIPGVVDWGSVWPWTKAVAVLVMTWFHGWLALRRKDFVAGTNTQSGRTFRMMNEVPTVLMLVIVISVVVKPF
ncbi:UNVERIFIED_CONTAM: hypothetical protein GTU68_018671 [Idotea baltica]|nr:hypothetical protein [Idotea baltica]